MKYNTAYSSANDINSAILELKQQLGEFHSGVLLYFASTSYQPDELSHSMEMAFKGCEVFGCSSSGELISGKMLDNSIVAMAFSEEVIDDIKVQIIPNIKNPEKEIEEAMKNIGQHFRVSVQSMDYKHYAGILLIDGLSGAEEKVIDTIGNYTNILVVGGSAGDDLAFKNTYVYTKGKAYSNAALFTVIKPTNEFSIIKTQSFKSSSKKLTVTKTNEEKREVLAFDNIPAAKAYAQALNTTPENLPNKMFRSPLGLMIDSTEPYVRSPRVVEGDSVFFYCGIKEGMELEVLESTDIIADTAKAIEAKKKALGNISAIINFNCILRTLDLKEQKKTEEYGSIFKDIPTIGFSTYGECYLGHINQTSTMLVFK